METRIVSQSGRGRLNNEPRKPKEKQTFMRTICDKTNSVNSDLLFIFQLDSENVLFKGPPLRTNITKAFSASQLFMGHLFIFKFLKRFSLSFTFSFFNKNVFKRLL